jgi:hypothetical protein
MSEPRARNSYRFEIHIFFRPRRSVDEPSRVRWWSRPSGLSFYQKRYQTRRERNQIANSDDACYQKAGPTCGERESDDAG